MGEWELVLPFAFSGLFPCALHGWPAMRMSFCLGAAPEVVSAILPFIWRGHNA
ncbi:MAG: hypothetical protein LBB38_01170 [Puniceicoccales bacterium]|nr:hypothetical protein [Puniceicoccales bacterium]